MGPYPLPQPVVSSADISKADTESTEVYECNKCVNNVTAEPVTHQSGAKKAEASEFVMLQEGVDDLSSSTELAGYMWAINKYWEVESEQS